MKAAGGAVTVLVGAVLLRLTLTGVHTRYVRAGMGPWLVVTGAVVILLGLTTLVRTWRRAGSVLTGAHGDGPTDTAGGDGDGRAHGDGQDGHHEHGGERIGWLLLAPIAALLLVAPPALGSYGVDRGARLDILAGASGFEPLSAGSGQPVPMSLLEFSQRAYDHDGASFGDTAVQLTGFAAGDDSDGGERGGDGDQVGGAGFRLARYQIACCAADAAPVVVDVIGTPGQPPRRDQWVTVTGTFQPGRGDVPRIAATTVVEISAPDDPYE